MTGLVSNLGAFDQESSDLTTRQSPPNGKASIVKAKALIGPKIVVPDATLVFCIAFIDLSKPVVEWT